MRHWLPIIVLLALAGCADSQSSQDQAFARFKGKPVSEVVLRWGNPESTVERPQGTIYTFYSQSQRMATTSSATNGFIGSTPITAISTSAAPITGDCRVNVFTDHQQLVVGMRSNGMNGPCVEMLERLR